MLGWVLWLQFLFSWYSHRMSTLRSSARSGWSVMPSVSLKSRGGSRDFQQVKQQRMANVSATVISVLGFSKDGNSFLYWRFVMTWRGIKIIPAALCDCSTSAVISRVCVISGLPLAAGWWEVGLWSSAAWSLFQAHVCYRVYSWADWFLPCISVAHPTISLCV